MTVDLIATLKDLAVPLGVTLLSFLWQGVLIATLYGLIRRNLITPSARLLAGHLALLAFVVAPLLTFVSIVDTGSALAQLPVAPGAAQMVAAASPAATGGGALASVQASSTVGGDLWLSLLVAVWAAGVAALSCRAWRQWRSLRQLCAEASPVGGQWQLRLQRLGARMGIRRGVRLLQSAAVHAPVVVGWVRPAILLPVGLIARMPPDQVEMLLLHELAHIRRADFLVNLVQIAIETLLFYHPAVHWVSRRIREDRELCCDDWVTLDGADRLRYARALLWLAEHEHEDLRLRPALAATGGVLLGRVERIVKPAIENERRRSRPWHSAVWVPVLLVLLTLFAGMRDEPSGGRAGLSALGLPQLHFTALSAPLATLRIADIAAPLELRPFQPVFAETPAPQTAPLAAPRVVVERDQVLPMPTLEVPLPTPALPALQPSLDGMVMQAPSVDGAGRMHDVLQAASAPADAVSVDAPAPMEIEPILGEAPAYPYRARINGIEGRIQLSFEIAADGTPVRIAAEGGGDSRLTAAARRALQAWRYDAALAGSGRHRVEFDFRLDSPRHGVKSAVAGRDCVAPLGSRICRPGR